MRGLRMRRPGYRFAHPGYSALGAMSGAHCAAARPSLRALRLILRSERSERLEGWRALERGPWFETPRCARLLTMRSERVARMSARDMRGLRMRGPGYRFAHPGYGLNRIA